MKTHMIVHSRGKAKQMQRKQKIILRSGHLKTHLLIYSEEKPHPCGQREESHREAESLKKHIYSITVERIHTVAQNAKRYSDRLEASVLICSFILERSCTHVDSVTNHSLKLLLWINICFEIVLLWFVEVMVEVVLDEATDEEVEEDMWRCLLCPWRRYWTVKEVTAGDVRPLAMFLYVTFSNIMIFLLRVLNVLHKIAMVTFLWLTLNWLHDLSNDIHERCHDKPLHDRQHEWPHWQYHDRPKLWYQGSFAILPC